jgi:hypothetical protein
VIGAFIGLRTADDYPWYHNVWQAILIAIVVLFLLGHFVGPWIGPAAST